VTHEIDHSAFEGTKPAPQTGVAREFAVKRFKIRVAERTARRTASPKHPARRRMRRGREKVGFSGAPEIFVNDIGRSSEFSAVIAHNVRSSPIADKRKNLATS
jgi:hypothetical protein